MWKYRSKSHLLALSISFIVGFILTFVSFSSDPSIFYELLPEDVVSMFQSSPMLLPVLGGFSFAGFMNLIVISQMIIDQFRINPIWVMILVFLIPDYLFEISTFLVIPVFCVCLYGVFSLRHSTNTQLKKANISSEEEIFRVYSLHHELKTEYESLAKVCKRNEQRINAIYGLGIVAIIILFVTIQNIYILLLAFVFYMFAFRVLLEHRAASLIPITSLLYESCDPEACVSAIYYYSQSFGKRLRLKQHTLLAQSLIYLNEPELAQDVLILYPKKDQASTLTYWSLMSYIYYMLKDDFSLQKCLDESNKIDLRFGRTGVTIQNEEVMAIENKINLMNGELSKSKRYYLNSLKKAKFTFQKVDAYYYIALISFVEEDYAMSDLYFKKVVNLGNHLYFVEKAKVYLDKIDNMDIEFDELS